MEYRVFISSPADVAPERARALRVIDRLNGEFRDHLTLIPIAWESQTFSAALDFQRQIAASAECDLVVGIVWARAGLPLDRETYSRPDGTAYESGTVYEIETALERARREGLPDVVLFRKDADPPLQRGSEAEMQVAQLRLLDTVLHRWLRTESGSFRGAFNSFGTTDAFEALFEQHLRDWLSHRGHAPAGPVWRLDTDGSPYPGLAAYGPGMERVFFGRAAARERCRQLLADAAGNGCAFLLILGASGAGKSSLARAGLLPRLSLPGSAPGTDQWRIAVLQPGTAPLPSLATSLFGEAALPELARGDTPSAADWAQAVAAMPAIAARSVAAALARVAPSGVRLLVLIDQLEETFDAAPPDLSAFAAVLDALARSGHVWLLATLRADRYGDLQAEPALLALKRDGATYDLPLPGPVEFDDIVRSSARAAGLSFEALPGGDGDLADTLLAAVSGADALPLLQMTLARLFEERDPVTNTLTFAAYERLGGLDGAIRERAELVFSSADPEARAELPALLLAFSGGLTEGGQVQARPVPLNDFAVPPARARMTKTLIEGRLLLVERQPSGASSPTGDARVRVAHEALLRRWPRAQSVLDPELVATKARLEAQLAVWVARGRTRGELLSGGPVLVAAQQLQRAHTGALSPDLDGFITASIRADRVRRNRRLAALGAVAAVFAGLAVLAGWFAQQARQSEGIAQQRAAAAQGAANGLVSDLAAGLRNQQGMTSASARRILDRAMGVLDTLMAQSPDDLRLKALKVDALIEFARTYSALGDSSLAYTAAREAVALAQTLPRGLGPNTANTQREAIALDELGAALVRRTDLTGALEAYRASAAISQRLADANPNEPSWQRDVSVSRDEVGDLLNQLGRTQEALSSFREGLDIRRRLAAAHPDQPIYRRDIANSQTRLAAILETQGDSDGALAAAREALKIVEELAGADASNMRAQRDVSVAHSRIGAILITRGDVEGGLTEFRADFAIAQRLARQDPSNSEWQRDLAVTLTKMGDAQSSLGRLSEALGSQRASLEIVKRLNALDPGNGNWQRDVTFALRRVAGTLLTIGDIGDAQAALEDALRRIQAAVDQHPDRLEVQIDLTITLSQLGSIYGMRGDTIRAMAVFQQSVDVARRIRDRDPNNLQWQRQLAASLTGVGDMQRQHGEHEAALRVYQESLDIRRRIAASDPSNAKTRHDVASGLTSVGTALRDNGDFDAALAVYRESQSIYQGLVALDPSNRDWQRDLSVSYDFVGLALRAKDDLDGALTAFRAALEIETRLADSDPSNTEWQRALSIGYDRIGMVMAAKGDHQGELSAYRADLAIASVLAARDPANTQWQEDLAISHSLIAGALRSLNDLSGAAGELREGLVIWDKIVAASPMNDRFVHGLVIAEQDLGLVLVALDHPDEAIHLFRTAIDVLEMPLRAAPDRAALHRDRADVGLRLARVLLAQHRAEEAYTQAVQAREHAARWVRLTPNMSSTSDALARFDQEVEVTTAAMQAAPQAAVAQPIPSTEPRAP